MFSLKAMKSVCINSVSLCVTLGAVFILSSCDLAANYTKTDRASNMEFQDFRDGMAERLPEVEKEKKSSLANIPPLEPYVSMTPSDMKSMPIVSVFADLSVPLRDILVNLAEQADYDIELDPGIRGSIIFKAKNKPLDVVIARISNIAGLRYKFEDSFIRIERDEPYIKTYKIDYLSFIRTNTGSVSTSVSVVSGEGADTGSSYSASSDSSSDFWGELELNLSQLLGGASTGALKTKRDPRVTATAQNPQIESVGGEGTDGADTDGATNTAQAPQPILNVETLPEDDLDDTSTASGDDDNGNGTTFSINKQAGMINVLASERTHEKVKEYLDELRKSVTSQVLVEAKIFEVSLFDEYINGIDWQLINNEVVGKMVTDQASDFMRATSVPGPFSNGLPFVGAETLNILPGGTVAANTNFVAGVVGNDIQALVRAVSGFGTVRALASPRLTVMNNQSAVLNVATNRVFFELDVDRETDDDTGDVTVEIDSEIKSVPEGVLINVQPSINLDNRTISMMIRPSITRITGTVQDPSVQFVAGDLGIQSNIPEVNVQEIDTVVKVNSGQPVVMGGLLQDRIVNNQEGVPGISEVPLFGAMFKNNAGSIQKTELVIFLKATLVDTIETTIHNTDRDLYKAFSGDRRPFDL